MGNDRDILPFLSLPVASALAKDSAASTAVLALVRSSEVPLPCLAGMKIFFSLVPFVREMKYFFPGTHASPAPVARERIVDAARLLRNLVAEVFPVIK